MKAAERLAREELLQLRLAESERGELRETQAGRISYPASLLSGESHFAMQETEATQRGKTDTHLGAERWLVRRSGKSENYSVTTILKQK